jgi:toxin ParE1/3/4
VNATGARVHAQGRSLAARPSRLDEIWHHIARDRVVSADGFVDRIERRFGLLGENPGLGVRRDDLRPGLRRFGYERYMIYHRLIQGGIEVVRVVHGARRQKPLLRR